MKLDAMTEVVTRGEREVKRHNWRPFRVRVTMTAYSTEERLRHQPAHRIASRGMPAMCAVVALVAWSGSEGGNTLGKPPHRYESGGRNTDLDDLRKLAESGNTRAQLEYGIELMRGEHVAQDLVRGYAWVEIAARCDATCSSAEVSAQAQDRRLALQKFLSGTQLIEAERIAESFLAPRLEAHRRAAHAAEQALLGNGVAEGMTLHPGCAAEALLGCDADPLREAGRKSCSGIVPKPERLPADRGPQARIRPPTYPVVARLDRSEGRVVIAAHVDYTGLVCQATVVRSSGSDVIDAAALDAFVRWRLQPAVHDGSPVDALFTETIDFSF
jgi:TonB family protein